jgi:hypothetical protein
MTASREKTVSLVQATRTLYGTRAPSNDQLTRVFRLMKSGVLPARDGGVDPLKWATTELALAELLAHWQVRRAHVRKDRESTFAEEEDGPTPASRQQDASAQLDRVYRNLWRDYFLAMMLRRRLTDHSVAFRRAVLAGQICLLLAFVGALVGGVRQVNSLTSVPVEHQAVERWIGQHTDEFAIQRWVDTQPNPGGDGMIVSVQYRYRKDSQRWIHTQREFNVIGDSATEVVAED